MSTTIFYYTGTGNSLWVAKKLAEKPDNTTLHSIPKVTDAELTKMDFDIVGFVFPVHIWGVPGNVLNFIERINSFAPNYCFAVATNGGQVANTLIQLQKFLKNKGVTLNSGFGVTLPSNYIPWGGPGPEEKQQKLFAAASEKIAAISDVITNRKSQPMEKGPLWQRLLFSMVYKASANHVREMDKKFRADEKCNSCKICAQVCPADNIMMVNGKPDWQHQCQQCYACLQWCPQEAIQYGKKTPDYERYQHPEIKLKEILKTN